jgi:predicted dehydrogenase
LVSIRNDEFEVVAVAEPIKERCEKFVQQHKITNVFHSWEELLEAKISCDIRIVATQDREHFHPTIAALDAGYHVLVEKPLS